jgi:glutathione synthase/RimK-type ligase-like ATP-grasp enzyme
LPDTMVAVHDRAGSFSDRWIAYLSAAGVPLVVVNGCDTRIVEQLRDCRIFLWHFHHSSIRDLRYARHVLWAAEAMGLRVFPNSATAWHYNDKVAQKYLLEAVSASLVPTWVFHDKDEASRWVSTATWPKVFKLRRGAGSTNVRLVKSRSEADSLMSRMFGAGMKATTSPGKAFNNERRRLDTWSRRVDGVRGLPNSLRRRARFPREQDYALFQEFVADNPTDTRVTVIGDRAFCFRRAARKNDFRASGSGELIYPRPDEADREAICVAFGISRRLGFQSMAYDLLTDVPSGRRLVCEISYAYNAEAVYNCGGYYDPDLVWHEGSVWPQDAILEDLLGLCGRVIGGVQSSATLEEVLR